MYMEKFHIIHYSKQIPTQMEQGAIQDDVFLAGPHHRNHLRLVYRLNRESKIFWNRLESLSVFLGMLIYRAVGRLAIPHIFVGNHFSLPR